jgi:chitin disaccharide deacetylase
MADSTGNPVPRVVVHQDDVGMCHGANVAFAELSHVGAITSGSVMVPCPWFSEAAELAAGDPALDLGVHLTLTSEKAHYRWRPLIGSSPASGLVDSDGFMWRDVRSVREHADAGAVRDELAAQLEHALDRFDVTHLDAHMGAVLAPEFCATYVELGVRYRLPVLLTASYAAYGPSEPHLRGIRADELEPFVAFARSNDMEIFDEVLETDFGRTTRGTDLTSMYRLLFTRASQPLTFLALHPNAPGEVELIEPEQSFIRTDEYEVLAGPEFLAWRAERPVRWIGMRVLRGELRSRLTDIGP